MNARARVWSFSLVLLAACGATPPPVTLEPEPAPPPPVAVTEPVRQAPPESGPAREVSMPAVVRETLASGLEVDVAAWRALPVVELVLIVRSGGETDPANLPGLSKLVAEMLKEGTRTRSSAQIAEAVEFLGADLSVASDEENVYVSLRTLKDHLAPALELLADVVLRPTFRDDELRKLKRRELDRLALASNDPGFLARREFYARLYGPHPYARVDTTVGAVERVRRADLATWHRAHVVPNNAILVAVGDVEPPALRAELDRVFAGWRPGRVPAPTYAPAPERTSREIVVVDRPESVQSMIYIGNLALDRRSTDYLALLVANQVLGGSAAARLFMDLRERRSLTYGAYSSVGERVERAPFLARASVRNEVTGEAVGAFFEHLGRITTEIVPEEELAAAKRYLSDSFPLRIDTPGKIVDLIADQRIFGLADDYWSTYRTEVREVPPTTALDAAQRYVLPDRALTVIVGRAADIVPALRAFGRVEVVDREGRPVRAFEAAPAPSNP